MGFSRRSAIILRQFSKILGMYSPMIASGPPGLRSGSPAPSAAFISSAHIASSSGGIPMKLPITRETIGWATSITSSEVSRPSSRSSTPVTISRIAGSWAAIRFGVNPAWNSIFRRSCLGGSIPMNIARESSRGKPTVAAVTPPFSEE